MEEAAKTCDTCGKEANLLYTSFVSIMDEICIDCAQSEVKTAEANQNGGDLDG